MSRPDLDADAAVTALTYRLRDWGVDEPGPKARAFIDDLQGRGWAVTKDFPFRRPPHKHEECGKHPGEYRLSCRGCGADRKAAREEAGHRERLTIDEARAAARAALADARQQTTRDAAPAVEEEAK